MTRLKKLLPHIVLMAYLLVILFPFLFVLFSSVKKDNNAIALNPFGIPKQFALGNYVEAWVNAKISTYFFNSLYISILSAVVSILIAAMFAFAITRMRHFKISALLSGLILVGMLIPNNALMLPIYLLVRKLGILDTHLALIIPYIANALTFSVIILDRKSVV